MDYDVTQKVNGIKTDISKEDDEIGGIDEYEDENLDFNSNNNENENSSNNKKDDDVKKKLIKLMIVIAVGMALLLIVLFLVSKVNGGAKSYEQVEQIMSDAAKSYFQDNKSSLPIDETQVVEIEVANLIAAEKMKTLPEYLGENTSCTGKVQVKKVGNEYIYTPFLSCGDKYSTKLLSSVIASDENLVGSGYGLYLLNDSYVFRGENVNNYIKLDGETWRIVKVNGDKTITLILNKTKGSNYPFDDRYNNTLGYTSGVNNYSSSRIKEQLDQIYKTTEKDDEYYMLSLKDKAHLTKFDMCVGKMKPNDTIHDNSIECSETISSNIGLLTVSDYMNASIDPSCNTPSSAACQNYNYLADGNSYWLGTSNSENDSTAYRVVGGVVKASITSEYLRIRPVITMDANTLISKGTGTEEDPYIIR